MFVVSEKCRTLKPQKAKVHYVPYKTSKLTLLFDGGLKLNSIAIVLYRGLCMAKAQDFSPEASFAH